MKPLRISYSLIKSWKDKDMARVNALILRTTPPEPTPAMEEGTRFHQECENCVKEHGRLSDVFGGLPITNPKIEMKLEMPWNSSSKLVGMIDILELPPEGEVGFPTLYELKTGKTSSREYSTTLQIPIYTLLLRHHNYFPESAYIIHYDQHTGNRDMTLVWLHDFEKQKAEIDSAVNELLEYAKEIGYDTGD